MTIFDPSLLSGPLSTKTKPMMQYAVIILCRAKKKKTVYVYQMLSLCNEAYILISVSDKCDGIFTRYGYDLIVHCCHQGR